MSILHYNFRSQQLGYYVNLTMAVPTGDISYFDPETTDVPGMHANQKNRKAVYKPGMKFQTLYLIHGGGDEDTLPYRLTNIERFAEENKVLVVTPGIPNTFGADALYGVNYFSFVTDELPVIMQSLFNSSPKREDNFVAGYAMGGNVALGLAITRPDLYCACVDISGGIGMTLDTAKMVEELSGDHFRSNFYRFNATFGEAENFPGSRHDLYPIAKKHKEDGDELCDFTMVCGSKEFIRKRFEGDVAKLEELGYPHKYIVMEGYDHDFKMWNDSLELALNEWLPLKREVLYP